MSKIYYNCCRFHTRNSNVARRDEPCSMRNVPRQVAEIWWLVSLCPPWASDLHSDVHEVASLHRKESHDDRPSPGASRPAASSLPRHQAPQWPPTASPLSSPCVSQAVTPKAHVFTSGVRRSEPAERGKRDERRKKDVVLAELGLEKPGARPPI